MRVEKVRDRYLLCGTILPNSKIKLGQQWAAADGSDHVVKINAVKGEWVGYNWGGSPTKYHEKTVFAFQCRYCLVVSSNEIPKEYC
jgi:hypothetical protein